MTGSDSAKEAFSEVVIWNPEPTVRRTFAPEQIAAAEASYQSEMVDLRDDMAEPLPDTGEG